MRKSIIAVALVALAVLPLWAAARTKQAAVVKILPIASDSAIKDWKVVPGALQYGKGEGLTDIYDGGYEDYIKAGVLDAARNFYQRKSDVMEITAHTMKSNKAAVDFFRRETKPFKGVARVKGGSIVVGMADGDARGYAYSGKYYITAFPMYRNAKSAKDTKQFLNLVIGKINKK